MSPTGARQIGTHVYTKSDRENEMAKQRKMTDAEFTKRVEEVGYVEACVESARRDGAPFNEAAIRKHAQESERAFAAYAASRLLNRSAR